MIFKQLSYELESTTQDELESLINSCKCKLYDIALAKENESLILRISIISNLGATTLEECAKVSEIISPFLDVKDLIKESYHLEVSSPGIERNLKLPRHFRLSLGQKVSVKKLDKSEFEAIIVSANESGVEFEKIDSKQKEFVPYNELKRAKTLFEW